ncbi:MAG TPA: ABC transporter ATP-binding protein [Firmicutes bacterium]|nr:ABC transporter ATP-binding protein [Bacillota bacterium]
MLEVRNLRVGFRQGRTILWAVRGISFTAATGEVTGLVGESGSGKSLTALAVAGLLPPGAAAGGEMIFAGERYPFARQQLWQKLRGKRIGMVFQDPQSSLNPLLPVGKQVAEPLRLHRKLPPGEAEEEVRKLFARLGINPAAARLRQYPHQLSGGLQQRVLLAAAIACRPPLLLADEPTTALDVTVQAQILKLLRAYVDREKAALVLISHDLGVIAQLADRVMVMCAGCLVETGSVADIMYEPLHPYTQLLLASLPRLDRPLNIPVLAEETLRQTEGCVFAGRCPYLRPDCLEKDPPLITISPKRAVKCLLTFQ